MSSNETKTFLDDMADLFLNLECMNLVSVSLEVAISVCDFRTSFLDYLASLILDDQSSEPFGKAAFKVCVFRRKGIPTLLLTKDCIRKFFFLIFTGLDDRRKIEYCLSESSDSVFVLMIGRNRLELPHSWRIVAGAIFSTHSSGVYLEYLGVTRERYDIYNFYWSKFRVLRRNFPPPEYDGRRMCWSKDKQNGIGTFLVIFIQKCIPHDKMGYNIFC